MIKYVKNWCTEFNPLNFAAMRRFFPRQTIFKTLSFLVLIIVLGFSPCGIKQSLKQIFSIENISSNSIKAGSSCQYSPTSTSQKNQQVAEKKTDFQTATIEFTDSTLVIAADKNGVRKARSVPLYILYQQLRTFLV